MSELVQDRERRYLGYRKSPQSPSTPLRGIHFPLFSQEFGADMCHAYVVVEAAVRLDDVYLVLEVEVAVRV